MTPLKIRKSKLFTYAEVHEVASKLPPFATVEDLHADLAEKLIATTKAPGDVTFSAEPDTRGIAITIYDAPPAEAEAANA